ncbi:MAG: hypothetical protein IJT60_02185 [Clostridia bacterium]|nr:hypothetical protein [Clostridia bacterium]
MILLCWISFALCAAGIFLSLRPFENKGIKEKIEQAAIGQGETLSYEVALAEGSKKPDKVRGILVGLRQGLAKYGKEKSVAYMIPASLILGSLGASVPVFLNIPVFSPSLALLGVLIPYWILEAVWARIRAEGDKELERSMQLISVSYKRTGSLELAVRENIDSFKSYIRLAYLSFLLEVDSVDPDIEMAIWHLRDRFDDPIFSEWCRALVECTKDRTFVETLDAIVLRKGEARSVNLRVRGVLKAARNEFLMMALMIFGNVGLLYLLNKDWFEALTRTFFGQTVLSLSLAFVCIGWTLVRKWTTPVSFHERDHLFEEGKT